MLLTQKNEVAFFLQLLLVVCASCAVPVGIMKGDDGGGDGHGDGDGNGGHQDVVAVTNRTTEAERIKIRTIEVRGGFQ